MRPGGGEPVDGGQGGKPAGGDGRHAEEAHPLGVEGGEEVEVLDDELDVQVPRLVTSTTSSYSKKAPMQHRQPKT